MSDLGTISRQVWGQIGESDCEALIEGALAQPVNALTSFAYVAMGLAIAIMARRSGRARTASTVYAVSLAAVGLGSVAFHGPQPTGSRVMHDLPILVTALFIAVYDAGLLFPRFRHQTAVFGVGVLVSAALAAVSLDLVAAPTSGLVVAVAVAEAVIYRRRLRPGSGRRQRTIAITIIVVAAVAGGSWLLGRTDGPVCDPDNIVQFHGLWHVISAVVFGLWWWLALGRPEALDQPSDPVR